MQTSLKSLTALGLHSILKVLRHCFPARWRAKLGITLQCNDSHHLKAIQKFMIDIKIFSKIPIYTLFLSLFRLKIKKYCYKSFVKEIVKKCIERSMIPTN